MGSPGKNRDAKMEAAAKIVTDKTKRKHSARKNSNKVPPAADLGKREAAAEAKNDAEIVTTETEVGQSTKTRDDANTPNGGEKDKKKDKLFLKDDFQSTSFFTLIL